MEYNNRPIRWEHNVPAGILDSVVRVGLYIEAWDVDYPLPEKPTTDERDRVFFNGCDLGLLEGFNETWVTVEKTVPVECLKEGVNKLVLNVDELNKGWVVKIRASELRFYCSDSRKDFSIGLTPTGREIDQGQGTDCTVNLVGLNGFSSAVDLSVSGLPAGLDGSFSLNPVTPSPTASSALTLTPSGSAAPGTYTVTVTGRSGEKEHSAELTLKINSIGQPDFTISSSPTSREVVQGESTSYSLDLTALDGFNASVDLSLTGLPSGASAQFGTNPIALSSTAESRLEITATDEAAAGDYTLTLTARGGEKERSVQLTLKIKNKPEDADFTIKASPGERRIRRGHKTHYLLKIHPENGFEQSVKLSLSGLPAGVRGSFTKNPVPYSPEFQCVLEIRTTTEAPVGRHTLTVTAEGGGKTHTLPVYLRLDQHKEFNLEVEPANRSVVQEETANYEVKLKSLYGFSDKVELAVEGLPAGTTAAFTPKSLTPDGEAQLAVTTSTETPVGTYTLTLTGSGGGIDHSAAVTLTVEEKPEDPDFTISAQPVSRSVHRGQAAHYNIIVTALNEFTGNVDFTIAGLPAEVTALFQPQTITGQGQAKLTLSTTQQTALGNYKLTVTGKSGDIEHSLDITLKVIEETPNPDFTLIATPQGNTVFQGGAAEYMLRLTGLHGFNSEVSFSAGNLPAGTSVNFASNPLAPDAQNLLRIETAAETPKGDYNITITGEGGGIKHDVTIQLIVTCPPFTAAINAEPGEEGPAPFTVRFAPDLQNQDKLPAGSYTYRWEFGDGTKSDEQEPQHTFNRPGDYRVELTVADPCGQVQEIVKKIKVRGFNGSISNSFSRTQALPGEEVLLTIEARNDTPMDFTNVTIRDELSPHLEYIGQEGNHTPMRSGNELLWQFPTFNRGETITIKVKARVSPKAPPRHHRQHRLSFP